MDDDSGCWGSKVFPVKLSIIRRLQNERKLNCEIKLGVENACVFHGREESLKKKKFTKVIAKNKNVLYGFVYALKKSCFRFFQGKMWN